MFSYHSIKKIKAPIGDENFCHLFSNCNLTLIKKIKAPIGDENGVRKSSCSYTSLIKKIKAPIGDENINLQIVITASCSLLRK